MPIENAELFLVGVFLITGFIMLLVGPYIDDTKIKSHDAFIFVAMLVVGVILVSFAVLETNKLHNKPPLKTNVIYETLPQIPSK